MGEELVMKVHAQNINTGSVLQAARDSGYAPGELFNIQDAKDQKEIRIWLA